MVDWNKVKKEYISANDVPTGHGAHSEWDNIFAEIPKNQALVLHEPEVNSGTIRAALMRKQRHGQFKNLRYRSKGKHGTATIYIVNTEKATPVIRLVPTKSQ